MFFCVFLLQVGFVPLSARCGCRPILGMIQYVYVGERREELIISLPCCDFLLFFLSLFSLLGSVQYNELIWLLISLLLLVLYCINSSSCVWEYFHIVRWVA